MNLLDHHILEIHSVKEVKKEWGTYVLADITVDCWGHKERTEKFFSDMEAWEKAKEKGSYLA